MTTPNQSPIIGLFPVHYEIGEIKPENPLLNLRLLVYPPAKKITGIGVIQPREINPLYIETKIEGTYSYMTVMPNTSHILVVATGYSLIDDQQIVNGGPISASILELRMVLSSDWKTGTANFSYLEGGVWKTFENQPVRFLS